MLAELADVLSREKFAGAIRRVGSSPAKLLVGYASLASIVIPAEGIVAIAADPDDDAVIACAVAAKADFIVSGDHHLLDAGSYGDIIICTVAGFLRHTAD